MRANPLPRRLARGVNDVMGTSYRMRAANLVPEPDGREYPLMADSCYW